MVREETSGLEDTLYPRLSCRIPQGIPTSDLGSEVKIDGFNHRRVTAGLRSVERMIARPSEDMSPAEVYMFPVLQIMVSSFLFALI